MDTPKTNSKLDFLFPDGFCLCFLLFVNQISIRNLLNRFLDRKMLNRVRFYLAKEIELK